MIEIPSQTITINGQSYFIYGKNRIKISEHFLESGQSLEDLIEEIIVINGNQRIA